MFAFQWTLIHTVAMLAVLLVAGLLIPFLFKEIGDGKRDLGPMRRMRSDGREVFGPETPSGAGDNRPGRPDNPAPGMPDAQDDPYGPHAQHHAPPVRS